MSKRILIVLTAVTALTISGTGLAATDPGGATMATDSMKVPGEMYLLGEQTVAGVKALAHVKDVHQAMAKLGMKQTHHLMVLFENVETGKPIHQGRAAVRVKDPSGALSEPVRLTGMGGHFGADLTLPKPGVYVFEIGTRLNDGIKRQFTFRYTLK